LNIVMSIEVAKHIRDSYEVIGESERALTFNITDLDQFLKKHNFSFEETGGTIRVGVYIVGRVVHPKTLDDEFNRLMAAMVSRPRKYGVSLVSLSPDIHPNGTPIMLMPPKEGLVL
jgi:hypothetical protein